MALLPGVDGLDGRLDTRFKLLGRQLQVSDLVRLPAAHFNAKTLESSTSLDPVLQPIRWFRIARLRRLKTTKHQQGVTDSGVPVRGAASAQHPINSSDHACRRHGVSTLTDGGVPDATAAPPPADDYRPPTKLRGAPIGPAEVEAAVDAAVKAALATAKSSTFWEVTTAFIAGGLFFSAAAAFAGAVYTYGEENVRYGLKLVRRMILRSWELFVAGLGAAKDEFLTPGAGRKRWRKAWNRIGSGVLDARKAARESVEAIKAEARLQASRWARRAPVPESHRRSTHTLEARRGLRGSYKRSSVPTFSTRRRASWS